MGEAEGEGEGEEVGEEGRRKWMGEVDKSRLRGD